MKNIHLLPMPSIDTIKNPGDLVRDQYGDIHIFTKNDGKEYGKTTTKLSIYITDDEKPKLNDWCLDTLDKVMFRVTEEDILTMELDGLPFNFKKIFLTTDKELINDGVQAIEDEFLEWFVKNPSCEIVDIGTSLLDGKDGYGYYGKYKIIIPKVENKQELPKTEIDWSRFPKSTQEQVGYVEPKQYPIGGFAPGYYSCKCVNCKTEFMGDKRAVQCKPCAIKITKEESKNICIQTGLPCGMQCLSEEACNMIKPEQKTLDGAIGRNGISDPKLNEIRLDIPKQETLEKAASRLLYNKYPAHPPRDSGYWKDMFIEGAKWQEEETIEEVFEWLTTNNYLTDLKETLIENFKNK